tara:strand:- start:1426 stop:1674 length:249 start_codon:yes stop_codon:yes gene_type:complete
MEKVNNMAPEFRKEAYRRFWMVKGSLACHLWDDADIIAMHDSYLTRLWHNEESYIAEEGFESAWNNLVFDVSKIAVLGGHFD